MGMRKGKCTNFGNCAIADTRQVVEVPQGNDFLCPDCKRNLTESGGGTAAPSRLPAVLIVGVVLLLGAAAGAWLLLKPAKKPVDSAATPAPVAVSTTSAGAVALKLHGSTTIGEKLAPALAAAFLRKLGATDVQVQSSGPDAVPEFSKIQGTLPGESKSTIIEVESKGSATAFTDLGSAKCDIGMSSRRVKPDEAASLSSLGDMTSAAAEHVIALDGIAVIVNPANQVSKLSKEQIADIFSGKIKSWSEVGGSGGPIQVYARDNKSGTYDSFKALVLETRPLVDSAVRLEDTQKLSDKVSGDASGIGFVGSAGIGSARAVAVSDTGTKALLPNSFTVATEDYILSRRLFLYTPAALKNSMARKFIEFAISKEGQDVASNNGFVSQNVKTEAVKTEGLGSGYGKLTAGAKRMSLNFRFKTGSRDLDNKAMDDLERVASFLADLKYTGDQVMLLGFADSTGGAAANVALSKDRAGSVSEQFSTRGIKAAVVTGFGADNPIASNDNEEGRQRNRRVEVWLKDRQH